MSTNTTIPRAATSRAPDDRFKDAGSANDRYSTITKIEVNSFQLDDSFEDNSDPYNSTGRFLVTAVKNRNRE
jgi:hypothetical protein